MQIVHKSRVFENMGKTRTVQNLGGLLGKSSHYLGSVVHLYKDLQMTMLTQGLRNVFYNKAKDANSLTPIESNCVEWEVVVDYIKEIEIVSAITGNGANGQRVQITTREEYYQPCDTFALDNQQHLFVHRRLQRTGNGATVYEVSLAGDGTGVIDVRYASKGSSTRYKSNFFPELSERGYVKYHKNTEFHRNYISKQRTGDSYSSAYAAKMTYMEYMKPGKGDRAKPEKAYAQMNSVEKDCMDHLMYSREQSLMTSYSNYDVNGKCHLQDDQGRDIPMGDGVLRQIERYAQFMSYSILTEDLLISILQSATARCVEPVGNVLAAVVTEKFWNDFQRAAKTMVTLRSISDGGWFYSKETRDGKPKKLKIGATINSYEFGGNYINIMPSRQLSRQYKDQGYAVFMDTGADIQTERANVEYFTIKGQEIITGHLEGLGGRDGKTSGSIATSVEGSSYHMTTQGGAVAFKPWASYLVYESKASAF